MIKEKECTFCKKTKPLKEFSNDKIQNDGLRYICKKCASDIQKDSIKTKEGLVKKIYRSQVLSSKKRDHVSPDYTSSELVIFALTSDEFNRLFDEWVNSNYEVSLIPTFDRKDDYAAYSFCNFSKWVSFDFNRNRLYSDKKNGINNKQSIAVIATDSVTGNELPFYSANSAQREIGVQQGNITKCCKGQRNSAGGYYWRYALTILFFISFNLSSQDLPKAFVINGDSGILISHEQLKFANRNIVTVSLLDAKIISLNSIINELNISNEIQSLMLTESNNKQSYLEGDIIAYRQFIKDSEANTRQQQKVEKKKKRRAVITGVLTGVIAGLIIGLLN